jgi:DNA-directed RNA polymerase subunit RPC12/RpoP
MYVCQHCGATFAKQFAGPSSPGIAESHAVKVRNERSGEMVILCPACASRLPKRIRFNPPQWIIRAALGLGYHVAIDFGGYWLNLRAEDDGLVHQWRTSNSPAFEGCNATQHLTPLTSMHDNDLIDLCQGRAVYVCA